LNPSTFKSCSFLLPKNISPLTKNQDATEH